MRSVSPTRSSIVGRLLSAAFRLLRVGIAEVVDVDGRPPSALASVAGSRKGPCARPNGSCAAGSVCLELILSCGPSCSSEDRGSLPCRRDAALSLSGGPIILAHSLPAHAASSAVHDAGGLACWSWRPRTRPPLSGRL